MINKTELKDVVLRFQSKTDISIKDIFGEAPSKEQEKMWVKFLKEYFKIEKEFSPKIIFGRGVVPPVPNKNNIENEIPKKRSRLLKKR